MGCDRQDSQLKTLQIQILDDGCLCLCTYTIHYDCSPAAQPSTLLLIGGTLCQLNVILTF